MRTRTVIATLSLLSAALLAGCGSDDDSASSSAILLSKAELKAALLTVDDLGSGYELDPDDDEDDESSLGCLDEIDEIDKTATKPELDDETSYASTSEVSLPAVFNAVGTFTDEDVAQDNLDRLAEAVEDCSEIDETDDEGFRVRLDVSTDTDAVGDADAQVNITATGIASTEGLDLPFSVQFSAIRVANHITLVGYVNMVKEFGDDPDDLNQRALARLSAAVSGEDAPSLPPLELTEVNLNELVSDAA